MIQRDFGESRRIEWRRVFALRGRQQFTFRHEDELGFVVDEPRDQPGTRDAVDFDVLPGNPPHRVSSSLTVYLNALSTIFVIASRSTSQECACRHRLPPQNAIVDSACTTKSDKCLTSVSGSSLRDAS